MGLSNCSASLAQSSQGIAGGMQDEIPPSNPSDETTNAQKMPVINPTFFFSNHVIFKDVLK
jgi:DNA gyrase/topoisomerase IV subunit A